MQHVWKKTSYGQQCQGCAWVGDERFAPDECNGKRYLEVLERFAEGIDQGLDNCERLRAMYECTGIEADDHETTKCVNCLAGALLERVGRPFPDGE